MYVCMYNCVCVCTLVNNSTRAIQLHRHAMKPIRRTQGIRCIISR